MYAIRRLYSIVSKQLLRDLTLVFLTGDSSCRTHLKSGSLWISFRKLHMGGCTYSVGAYDTKSCR